ncbi:MAG: hypothetical protein ACLVBP_02635 [Ruminococcus sp.]
MRGLSRKKIGIPDEGTLNVAGRDMESQKLKIRFNKCTFQWEYVGTEEDV